ncbi:MAG: Gfo/Idh/MocA family oxidoreductase [Fimbriimonadaceae bacterium]|nr:Gfo/Idh/MocA family oxidoreductase [Fimbriimonadaceae bacterium]
MSDLGVGIVGYGLAGRLFHRMLVDATPGLRVAAVMSRAAEKLEQARQDNPQAAVVDSFEALVQHPAVDLVVLATPHHLHCEQTVAALGMGKPVVVDKIMARSVAEADAMIAAADRAGQLLSVFHNRRWDSDFLTVRKALDDGLLGEPWSINIALTMTRMPLQPLTGERRWRSLASAFGGQLVDWGAHLMDQAVLLGGSDPDRVFADLQFRQEGNETDTEAFVALHYRRGLRITVTVSLQSWTDQPHWQINGSQGGLRLYGIDPQEALMRANSAVIGGQPAAALPAENLTVKSVHPTDGFAPVPGDWRAYYANVRDALLGRAALAVTPQQCRDVLRVYERAFRAAGIDNETTRRDPV